MNGDFDIQIFLQISEIANQKSNSKAFRYENVTECLDTLRYKSLLATKTHLTQDSIEFIMKDVKLIFLNQYLIIKTLEQISKSTTRRSIIKRCIFFQSVVKSGLFDTYCKFIGDCIESRINVWNDYQVKENQINLINRTDLIMEM